MNAFELRQEMMELAEVEKEFKACNSSAHVVLCRSNAVQ